MENDNDDNKLPAEEIFPDNGAQQRFQSTDETSVPEPNITVEPVPIVTAVKPVPKFVDFVVSGLVVSLVFMTVKFGLSEEEFLFIGVPVSLEILTLCNAGAIAVIMFLRTVLPSLIKDTAPYLSYSDDSEGGFQFALNKLFEFLDAKEDSEVDNQGAQEKKEEQKKDNDDAVGEDEPAGTAGGQRNKEVDKKDTKEENPKETTLLIELSAILKALRNLIILALQAIRGLSTIAHVILVSTLTSLLIFTVGCASVSLPRWSKGLPPMAVLYGLIICKFKEEIHHCITVLPTENTVLLLLLSTVGFLVVGWRAVATVCLLVLLAITPPLLASTAKVRLPDGWHKYLLVLAVMLVQMFPDFELTIIVSMKNWISTILGLVVFRGFIASKVLSDQSQRLIIVVVAVFLTACFYYRGLVFMVERLPAPQGPCIGGGRPTPILNKSSCTNIDFASTRFFKSAIYVNETSNLVGTYRDNHYTVIGLTSSSPQKKKEVPEMNFTGVVAFNNRSNDVAIVIHDIALKSGLAANYYNFYKYYHKAVRDEHHNLVHYIFGMLKANVSSVTVVARAEHGIMAKIIAEDINEQIELFEYYDTDSCVRTQLICKKARTESSRVCSSSGNLLVNESIAEFERSVLDKQLLAQKKKTSLIKSTTKNGFYTRQSSQKWSSGNDRPVEEVTRHIVYGEIAVFVDDTIENSVRVAYRENLFTCKQTFEAIVESFFPGYEYWHELRGFAEKDGNPVHGIVLFHAQRGEVLIALRSALEEELLLGDSGLYDLEKWNATSDDGRVSQKLFQVYTRTGIQLQYPQRSLRSSCRAVLDKISKEHPHQNITVAVTGHSSGAAMAVVVALDLADKVARYKSYASINAVKVVSFALPPVIGNAAMTKKLQELNVSHIHYYQGEDHLVVKSTAEYGFDAEMNQVARPLTMDLEAKRPGAEHLLDVILFHMARSVNISRRLHSEKFDPIESFFPIGQCDDFRKYIFDVFCEDYQSTRGKKCDSKAELSLDGANDFKFFLEEHVTSHLKKMFCDGQPGSSSSSSSREYCSELITESLDAIDNLESVYDVIVKSVGILAAQKFFDDDITVVFKALEFYHKFKLF